MLQQQKDDTRHEPILPDQLGLLYHQIQTLFGQRYHSGKSYRL